MHTCLCVLPFQVIAAIDVYINAIYFRMGNIQRKFRKSQRKSENRQSQKSVEGTYPYDGCEPSRTTRYQEEVRILDQCHGNIEYGHPTTLLGEHYKSDDTSTNITKPAHQQETFTQSHVPPSTGLLPERTPTKSNKVQRVYSGLIQPKNYYFTSYGQQVHSKGLKRNAENSEYSEEDLVSKLSKKQEHCKSFYEEPPVSGDVYQHPKSRNCHTQVNLQDAEQDINTNVSSIIRKKRMPPPPTPTQLRRLPPGHQITRQNVKKTHDQYESVITPTNISPTQAGDDADQYVSNVFCNKHEIPASQSQFVPSSNPDENKNRESKQFYCKHQTVLLEDPSSFHDAKLTTTEELFAAQTIPAQHKLVDVHDPSQGTTTKTLCTNDKNVQPTMPSPPSRDNNTDPRKLKHWKHATMATNRSINYDNASDSFYRHRDPKSVQPSNAQNSAAEKVGSNVKPLQLQGHYKSENQSVLKPENLQPCQKCMYQHSEPKKHHREAKQKQSVSSVKKRTKQYANLNAPPASSHQKVKPPVQRARLLIKPVPKLYYIKTEEINGEHKKDVPPSILTSTGIYDEAHYSANISCSSREYQGGILDGQDASQSITNKEFGTPHAPQNIGSSGFHDAKHGTISGIPSVTKGANTEHYVQSDASQSTTIKAPSKGNSQMVMVPLMQSSPSHESKDTTNEVPSSDGQTVVKSTQTMASGCYDANQTMLSLLPIQPEHLTKPVKGLRRSTYPSSIYSENNKMGM